MNYYLIIRGPLGCGKTTISKELAKKLNAKHISIDSLLDKHGLTNDKEEGYISQKSFIKANEIAIREAKRYLTKNKPVIFDGNFYWKSQIDHLINNLKFQSYVFTLHAPLKVCIERDSKRISPHGEGAAMVVYNKVNSFNYGNVIDVSKPINKTIQEIISYLSIH